MGGRIPDQVYQENPFKFYWPKSDEYNRYNYVSAYPSTLLQMKGTAMNPTTHIHYTYVGIVTTSDGRYRGNWQVVATNPQAAVDLILTGFKAITEGDIIRLNKCTDSGLSHEDNYIATKPALRATRRPNDNMPEWDINGNGW